MQVLKEVCERCGEAVEATSSWDGETIRQAGREVLQEMLRNDPEASPCPGCLDAIERLAGRLDAVHAGHGS